jgi:transposase
MSYDYHIGVDYHKAYSHIVVQDSAGNKLRCGRVENSQEAVESFLSPFDGKRSHAVVEATRNWTVMFDLLEPLCDEVLLANPLKVKAIADAKIKTDKIDATILSHLLRTDLLPTAHVPSTAAREMRQMLRERTFFVRLRTMAKNRIVTIFDRYPEEVRKLRPKADQFCKAGRAQLATLPVSDTDRMLIDRECELIDQLNAHIAATEKVVKAMSKGNANVRRLKTIPGLGEFFARLVDAEIDDISRFRSPKKLAAYVGLVPSTYASGGKVFNGRIIKGGNKWLRWAFVEAVQPATLSDPWLKEEYDRIKARKGSNKAKVAIARRLLTIAYHVLKEERNYHRFTALERASRRVPGLS